MRKLLLIPILSLFASSAFAATTHYISKSAGADTNNGTTKTTPWAHFPGMPNCASQCAAYTPVPGDSFILKGGDTWVAADLGINFFPWQGTVNSRIYIGVDKTWFTGTSWTRPKFDCQNTECSLVTGGAILWIYADYVTLDNIEMTGFKSAGNGTNLITTNGIADEVENFYMHGWSRGAGTANSFAISLNFSSKAGRGAGTRYHDNVIDGADDPNKDFMGGILHGDMIYNNVIRYVYNGFNGAVNDFHGNLVELNYIASSGDHCNMVFPQDILTGNTIWIYNNVIRHAMCPGGTVLFTLANSSNTSSVAYQYNNVTYDNELSCCNGIGSGGHTATGVYWDHNNTVVSESSCFGNGDPTASSITHYGNNQCIGSGTLCIASGTTCTNDGGNLQRTLAQANAAGYNSSQTYAYSPTAANSPTVGIGTNRTSLCSGNVAALCSDTTYATYDSVNHVVVMRTVNPRPASAAWDAGAYQFAGSAPAVSFNPPTVDFGPQAVGQASLPVTITVKNPGTANLTVTSFTLQTGTNFSIGENTCGSPVAPAGTCNVLITFTPISTGTVTDNLSVADNVTGSPQLVPLAGSGAVTAPAPVAFAALSK